MDRLLKRTHYCGTLRKENIGETVTVNGWVAKNRRLGSLIFADIRDRSGIVQVVFGDGTPAEAIEKAETLRSEYAVGITNEELVLQLMLEGEDVSPVYAKEGITLRNSFTGIIANCQHLEAAKAFIDFAISKPAQQACADELLMRSVRPDVAFSGLEGIPSSGDLPALNYPQEWVNANPKLKAALQSIIAAL